MNEGHILGYSMGVVLHSVNEGHNLTHPVLVLHRLGEGQIFAYSAVSVLHRLDKGHILVRLADISPSYT